MRYVGMTLLLAGFFGAVFAAVRNADVPEDPWAAVSWGGYAAGMLAGVAGVVVLRTTARREASQSHKVEANLDTLDETLGRVVTTLGGLEARREAIGVYGVHGFIDENLAADLGAFADAREALIPRYGLQAYADVMTRFAGGERLINRAWSASADGYIDEVETCLERAGTAMRDAHGQLRGLRERNGPATSSA